MPGGRGRKEDVADEMLMGGIWGRINSKPVEVGRGFDSRPLDLNWIAGFGEDGRGERN